jgi:hypothetical protein
MRPVLVAAEAVWRNNGIEEGVTITSGLDGVHSAGSYHPFGYAIDLRTRYFADIETVNKVAKELKASIIHRANRLLYPSYMIRFYNVVVEKTHIHVEFEVDKGLR